MCCHHAHLCTCTLCRETRSSSCFSFGLNIRCNYFCVPCKSWWRSVLLSLVHQRCVKTHQDLHTCGPVLRSSAVKIILITPYKADWGVKPSRHLVRSTPGQDLGVVKHARKQFSHSNRGHQNGFLNKNSLSSLSPFILSGNLCELPSSPFACLPLSLLSFTSRAIFFQVPSKCHNHWTAAANDGNALETLPLYTNAA